MPPLSPHFFVRDLQRSIAFYRDGMGFELRAAHPPDNPVYASLDRGEVHIMLTPLGESFGGWPLAAAAQRERAGQGGATTLYIEGHDLEAELERAIQHGATLIDPIADRPWGQREFSIADPDGFWWSVWSHTP